MASHSCVSWSPNAGGGGGDWRSRHISLGKGIVTMLLPIDSKEANSFKESIINGVHVDVHIDIDSLLGGGRWSTNGIRRNRKLENTHIVFNRCLYTLHELVMVRWFDIQSLP